MTATPLTRSRYDDPRKLRELIQRAVSLATDYEITSTVVGMSGEEGDLLFPEMVDYIESALRVDDGIFRLLRERAVFFLADADCARATDVMERLLIGFREKFTPSKVPRIDLGFFEVTPENAPLTVRDVLPSLFGEAPADD